jgi:hypothetical protein
MPTKETIGAATADATGDKAPVAASNRNGTIVPELWLAA